jgi:hypothetical protein
MTLYEHNDDIDIARALRDLYADKARFDALKATFDEAIAELDRTGGTPLDFEEIKRKARARLLGDRDTGFPS